MPEQHEVAAQDDVDVAYRSELAAHLNASLDDALSAAKEQFEGGQRSGGFKAVVRYFLTFLHTGLVEGNFLRGRQGLIACSVAAQDAYNRAVMSYCFVAQKK